LAQSLDDLAGADAGPGRLAPSADSVGSGARFAV